MSRRMIVNKVKDNIPCIFISPQASIKFINPRSCGVKTFCRLKNLIIQYIKTSLKSIFIVYKIIIFWQHLKSRKCPYYTPLTESIGLALHIGYSLLLSFTRKGNVTFTSSSVQQQQP